MDYTKTGIGTGSANSKLSEKFSLKQQNITKIKNILSFCLQIKIFALHLQQINSNSKQNGIINSKKLQA